MSFYKGVHLFSMLLWAHKHVFNKMDSKYPNDTQQWIVFGSILSWLVEHHYWLMIHVADKQHIQTPSTQWCIIAEDILLFFELTTVTISLIQSLKMVMSKQRQELSKLIINIVVVWRFILLRMMRWTKFIPSQLFNFMICLSQKILLSCTSNTTICGHWICTTTFSKLNNNKHRRRSKIFHFPLWQTDCRSRQSMIWTIMLENQKSFFDANRFNQDAFWLFF